MHYDYRHAMYIVPLVYYSDQWGSIISVVQFTCTPAMRCTNFLLANLVFSFCRDWMIARCSYEYKLDRCMYSIQWTPALEEIMGWGWVLPMVKQSTSLFIVVRVAVELVLKWNLLFLHPCNSLTRPRVRGSGYLCLFFFFWLVSTWHKSRQ